MTQDFGREPERPGRVRRLATSQLRAPIAPATGAVVLWWLSLTPSLLPLGPVFQALVSALCALLGYGAGALIGWGLRASGVRLTGAPRRHTVRVGVVLAAVGSVVMVILGHRWDDWLRDAVGTARDGWWADGLQVLLTAVIFALLVMVSRMLKAAGAWSGRQIGRVLPERVALVVGAIVVGWLSWQVTTGVLGANIVQALDGTFKSLNDEFSADLPAPTTAEVSGGPGSAESWQDLGRQGRVFIANTPTPAQISAFSGTEAMQPVRAYVGARAGTDAPDLAAEAQRAVAELERTGGFDRAVLNVATGTGRGWVNENQARALEFMWNGDTATVSMQYSYLPSWMSFLVDGDRSQEAGRILFDAVYAHWVELPRRDRPLLVVSGESLGSFGGEAAFSGAQDLATRTDGALFVGPTNNNRLWSRFTAERDPSTPQILPVYGAGAIVRFADQAEDWTEPGPWQGTKVGYLQHPNDPITWWDWSLALDKPDWLAEPRGRGVSPATHWIPFVTMLQLGANQFVANSVPPGQGHQFGQEPVRAWAEILPPEGWTEADTDKLVDAIAALEPDTIS